MQVANAVIAKSLERLEAIIKMADDILSLGEEGQQERVVSIEALAESAARDLRELASLI